MSNPSDFPTVNRPWWAFGHVWLVIAGPLVVVVASFITFYLAANGQDPVPVSYTHLTLPTICSV